MSAQQPTPAQLTNAIRILSMDAVEQAQSGHPGMPMGMADIAFVLWQHFLKHNPRNPAWANRDRFVLSNGHGSMLLYALLHLTGYDLSLSDIKKFRQLKSKTPGHPEFGMTPGVETTTGPLGQGLANAVGMALAEQQLATTFNRPDQTIIDHFTYVFLGDGCLMEGISHEVCSLAGTLHLGKLICFWDDNGISIDGEVSHWFSDNTPQRFSAYGWHVIANVDGHDQDAIFQAIVEARSTVEQPTLICCRTEIGFGAPTLSKTAKVHGAPLGDTEIAAVRKQLGWSLPPFEIPEAIYQGWNATEAGEQHDAQWQQRCAMYSKQYPDLYQELQRRWQGQLPEQWSQDSQRFIDSLIDNKKAIATRKASLQTLNHFAPLLPELIGGSADLTESNLTRWSDATTLTTEHKHGNYIHYGVREFGMSAMMTGMALYQSFIPFGGTFLTFSDYAKNAVRMAALMRQRVIFVYTHDSIGLGEDGPTHQPIEHLATLRLIPNVTLWRPCDTLETAVAWKMAIEHKQGPSCLALTRQSVPQQQHPTSHPTDIARGGYILVDCPQQPNALIIATGSEVALAVDAAATLTRQGYAIRVISMPSTDIFLKQDKAYQHAVLPPEITARVAVEAGICDFWYQFVGLSGTIIGLNSFGESAPANDVYRELKLTTEHVINAVIALLK